jgi:pimeloyl-ACP methyl ester carboxylesterase
VWHDAGYVAWLADEFKVICIDQRGSGESDKPTSIDAYRTARLVEDVLAVADAAEAPMFHLWGFSYGANTGRYVALASPRVISMIYIGIPFGPAAAGSFRETILGLRAKWQPILDQDSAGTLDTTALPEADRTAWSSGQVPLRLAWLSAMLDYEAVEPGDLPCPTLWAVGTENKEAMRSVSDYRDRLGGSRVSLEILDGLTHAQELERVDVLLPVARAFTRRQAR